MLEQPKRGRSGGDAKTVYLRVTVFANPKTGQIHVGCRPDFITSVSNKPGSRRYHPNLYSKLKAVLQREGKWPADMPFQGADAPVQANFEFSDPSDPDAAAPGVSGDPEDRGGL